MLDARIVATSTQSLALAAQSPTTRTDWMVPSSHGLDLTLGTRDCSSRPNSGRELSPLWADNALFACWLLFSRHPLAMSALGHKRTMRGVRPMSALPPKADIECRGSLPRTYAKRNNVANTLGLLTMRLPFMMHWKRTTVP